MTMINANCPDSLRTAPKMVAPRLSILAALANAHSIWRQRQKLKSLDDSALWDIGLTRSQAQAEAKRPFWDAPDNWKV
ncbi:MAG: DUF1127 domain-containing protein [Rhodobacteraceae bacterium]|nr:DUF1127 domain-containing protein [Paracoccaceae bacterium]